MSGRVHTSIGFEYPERVDFSDKLVRLCVLANLGVTVCDGPARSNQIQKSSVGDTVVRAADRG